MKTSGQTKTWESISVQIHFGSTTSGRHFLLLTPCTQAATGWAHCCVFTKVPKKDLNVTFGTTTRSNVVHLMDHFSTGTKIFVKLVVTLRDVCAAEWINVTYAALVCFDVCSINEWIERIEKVGQCVANAASAWHATSASYIWGVTLNDVSM